MRCLTETPLVPNCKYMTFMRNSLSVIIGHMGKTAIIDIDNTLWQFCDAFYVEMAKLNENFSSSEA